MDSLPTLTVSVPLITDGSSMNPFGFTDWLFSGHTSIIVFQSLESLPIQAYSSHFEAVEVLKKFYYPLNRIKPCMKERTTTVTISDQGRLYVPKPVRESLGIDGKEMNIEIAVRIDEDEIPDE